MSLIIEETFSQFIDVECLIEALEQLNVDPQVKDNLILIKIPQLANIAFTKNKLGGYLIRGENNIVISVLQYLKQHNLDLEYQNAFERKQSRLQEEERQRLEAQRAAHIESLKQNAIKAAKAQGFSVKNEVSEDGKIKLVLIRHI